MHLFLGELPELLHERLIVECVFIIYVDYNQKDKLSGGGESSVRSIPVPDTKFIGPCLCIAGYELVESNGEYS